MNKKRGIIAIVLILFLSACNRKMPAQTEFVLGTICSVNLFEDGSPELYRSVFLKLQELENIFSANKEGTELYRINEFAGIEPVAVGGELITVLNRALYFAQISGEAFDPSIGPLVKLWGIGTENAVVPGMNEISAALALIDRHKIEIDQKNNTVFLKDKGMRLDLGGIAKGYAADCAAKIIKDAGVNSALIDLGGNIYALGEKNTGRFFKKKAPWKIGVQDPEGLRGAYLGVALVKNSTLVTSGVYERFLEIDGVRYHHILSTKTGYPADSGILSVTIIADASNASYVSMDADALSTTLFVLGYERGAELLKQFDFAGAVFVTKDDGIKITDNISSIFEIAE